MRGTWVGTIVLGLVSLSAGLAKAQTTFELHHLAQPRSVVAPSETVPDRPLMLRRGGLSFGGGLYVDLSSGIAGDTLIVPLGTGYGVTDRLELGVDSEWLLRPFGGNTLVANANIYGRFLIISDLLAVNVSLYFPTVVSDGTAAAVEFPARYRLPGVELYGSFDLLYRIGESFDLDGEEVTTNSYIVALSASALIDVGHGLFTVGDLGFSTHHNDFGSFTGDNKVVTVGLGAGYALQTDLFLKLGFVLGDMAQEDVDGDFDGFANRGFTLSLVQLLDLGYLTPSAKENPEEPDF